MSPNNVNDLASSFVQMAKAFEELPGIQRELENALKANTDCIDTIAQREERILNLRDEIDSLHSKIRELEVAKDQAETMFLEADERTARALDFIRSTFGSAGSLIQALEPEKAKVEAATTMIGASTEQSANRAEPMHEAQTEAMQPAKHAMFPEESASQQSMTNTSSASEPIHGPFFSKRYYDHPFYVKKEDWLSGGGTEADYEWRPDSQRHGAGF